MWTISLSSPRRWIPHPAYPSSPWGPAQKPTRHKKSRCNLHSFLMCLTLIGHAYTFRGHSIDRPSKVKGIFLAFVNFYWWFIRGFSTITTTSFSHSRHFYVLPAQKNLEYLRTAKIRAIEKQVELFHYPNSISLFWVSNCLSSRQTVRMIIRERLLAAWHVEKGDAWTLSLDSPLLKGEHHHLNCHWDSLRCFAKCLSLKKTAAQKL